MTISIFGTDEAVTAAADYCGQAMAERGLGISTSRVAPGSGDWQVQAINVTSLRLSDHAASADSAGAQSELAEQYEAAAERLLADYDDCMDAIDLAIEGRAKSRGKTTFRFTIPGFFSFERAGADDEIAGYFAMKGDIMKELKPQIDLLVSAQPSDDSVADINALSGMLRQKKIDVLPG